jgi:hypothetical protein
MSNDKYELTNETKRSHFAWRTLHRIKALRDIGTDVKAGDLGGWIEQELNLATFGECWIYDDACCYAEGRVSNDAQMRDRSECSGGWVIGNAVVTDDVFLTGGGKIMDNARAHDHAQITGYATVFGTSTLTGFAYLDRNALIGPNQTVHAAEPMDFASPVKARMQARRDEREKHGKQ